LAIDELGAVIAMNCKVAGVTVRVNAFEVTPPELAVIVDVPLLTAVAKPAALMVATPGVAEFQTAVLVRFCVVPSVNVPVAVNWSVSPLAIDKLGAVIAIDFSTAGVTVNVNVFEVTPPELAVMAEVPMLTPVASPAVLMVATAGVAEFHVTVLVRFCVEPSVNVPVAENWSVSPLAIVELGAVIAIDCRIGAATVSCVEPTMVPLVAEI